MISLVVDTETTGFPTNDIAPDHPAQARVKQIAMLLLDGDEEVGSFHAKLVPSNWPVTHAGAIAAHGITDEVCARHGVSQSAAIRVLQSFTDVADCIVSYNWRFDSKMLDVEIALLGASQVLIPSYCTMELMTPVMKLTKVNGSLKYPRLSEAIKYCCPNHVLKDEHDALSDARMCSKIWIWIIKNGIAKFS